MLLLALDSASSMYPHPASISVAYGCPGPAKTRKTKEYTLIRNDFGAQTGESLNARHFKGHVLI